MRLSRNFVSSASLASLVVLALVLPSVTWAAAITVVDDAVEPSNGWTGNFNNGFGLTTPIEGSNMIGFTGAGVETGSKSFTGVLLSEGDYSATFWVHNFSNNVLPAPGLTANLQANGLDISDLLTSSSTASPAAGDWEQWTLNYTVSAGDIRIGQTLGFFITDIAGSGNGGFDSLDVTFDAATVPEPSALALICGASLAGLGFAYRRRRQC